MSRLLNILIAILVVALVGSGAYLAYVHIWQDKPAPVDPATQRAIDAWEQAVRDDPNNALARANLGATYLDAGRVDDAIKQLETALDIEPDSFPYMLQLGYAYNAAGDYGRAFEAFVNSAEKTPEHEKYIAYYEAAAAADARGDTQAAQDYAAKSIADNDSMWNPHQLLGQLYEADGDREKALAEYQEAAAFNPDDQDLQQAIKRVS